MREASVARWYRRRWVRIALAGAVLALVVALGPRERFEERWVEPELPVDLDAYVEAAEAAVPGIRPGDQRGIVWAEQGRRGRTPLSLVYLHGFSADRHELEPLVSNLATELGANAYYARLTGHGRDGAAMAEATVEDWLDDAAEAMAIGSRIGERVVLIGVSTGGTLALWAAARDEVDGRLAALVLISPNLRPKDRTSRVLLYPWGGLVARLVIGAERCFAVENAEHEAHWTSCYPTAALLPMMALTEHVRTLDLGHLEAPTLAVYSPDDDVVDVQETERVVGALSAEVVELVRFDGSADRARHVLAGDIISPGSTDALSATVLDFLLSVLGERETSANVSAP